MTSFGFAEAQAIRYSSNAPMNLEESDIPWEAGPYGPVISRNNQGYPGPATKKFRIAVRKPKRIGGKPELEPQRIHHEIEESLGILSHKLHGNPGNPVHHHNHNSDYKQEYEERNEEERADETANKRHSKEAARLAWHR